MNVEAIAAIGHPPTDGRVAKSAELPLSPAMLPAVRRVPRTAGTRGHHGIFITQPSQAYLRAGARPFIAQPCFLNDT
jgi:hypothetical protein